MNMRYRQDIELYGHTFEVYFEVCDAEPDVGILAPYVEVLEMTSEAVEVTEDLHMAAEIELAKEFA